MSGLVDSTNYIDYWKELTSTICKLVELTRTITTKQQNQRYQAGKDDWTEEDQLSKVSEECFEIIKANYHQGQNEYAEENLDLLFATLNQLHRSNLTEQQIIFAVGTCLAKFQKRGWLF